jgi:hypothetical protein
VLLLLHAPIVTVLANAEVVPIHADAVPVIAAGVVFTVVVAVAEQTPSK